MNSKQWSRAKDIFNEALERQHHEREPFVRATCSDDNQLADEVLSLLAAYEQTGPLDRPSGDIGEEVFRQWQKIKEEMKGARIGAYRILEEIGHGGMGRVFLAERADDQFDKQVALKLLAAGIVTEPQMDRFLEERQILASLNHPNIATLIDGGITDDGQPWFAMEYVEGTPIHHYCSRNKLKTNERLDLFITVCNAVQFAHQNLVIHRDLKPANILVTGNGIVKLLDFGIANVMGDSGEVSNSSNQTVRNFTPFYASPEQLIGESMSTASDVYQLGTILFELLTGRILQKEMARGKRSEKKRSLSEALSNGSVSSDLEAIIRKSVEADPASRYESAEQLDADIHRYLNGRPVKARIPTKLYRTQKFLGRHPAGIIAFAVILLILIGYAITVTWYTNRTQMALEQAEEESRKSAQVTDFLMGMFEAGDPAEASGDIVTAQTLLRRGVAQAEELNDQPDVQAEMYSVIGKVYYQLGDYNRSADLLKKSLPLRDTLDQTGTDLADTYYSLGSALHHDGEYAESNQYFQKAIAIYDRLDGFESKEYAKSLYTLAGIHNVRGDYDTAESMHRRALEMQKNLPEPDRADIAMSYHGLGTSLYLKNDPDASLKYLNKAMNEFLRVHDGDHPDIANLRMTMGRVYASMDQNQTAEEHFLAAQQIQEKIFGVNHTETQITKKTLADFYRDTGKYQRAEEMYLSIYQHFTESEDRSPLFRPIVQALSKLYMQTKEFEQAAYFQKQTVTLLEDVLNPDHPRVKSAKEDLSEIIRLRYDADLSRKNLANNP